MARNDGIDRTFARNQDLPTLDDVAKVQEHNEREKASYSNQDIDTAQTYRNIHFKAPTDSYAAMFDQMIADGIISTRGLKADAVKYGELIFDVNSAYFHNHGGYEYAKQFYTDAYKAAVEIVGGEQYILSAVMHADEINRAMRLYEDWAAERITEYNFNMLSEKYQKEQGELAEKIERIQRELACEEQEETDVDRWIELIRQYAHPTELNAGMLNALIEKILVHEKTIGEDGEKEQEIEIFYRFVGKID